MERFKIYNILHQDHLGQITLSLTEDSNYQILFDQLDEKRIKLKFIAFQQEKEESLRLSFCVESKDLEATQEILSNHPLKDEDVHINPDAGLVAIYGPHFVERPGIIDAMHNALFSQGVKILGISTTVSTSFFVIPASQVVQAVTILREAFEIPQGKV
jgi:aspartokinase